MAPAEIVGDGAKDPGLHDAVHARPVGLGSSKGSVGEDVVAKRELADDEEELVPPASVAAGDVEDDGDQTPDVLDCHRLRAKIDDGRGFVEQQGLMEIARIRRGDAVGVPVGVLIGGGEGGVALALSAR